MDNIDRARKSEQGGKEKKNAFVAAIGGLSGAGKTALVEKVAQALGGAVTFYYDAIAAYLQEDLDRFLGLDREDELVIYLAPVGKV